MSFPHIASLLSSNHLPHHRRPLRRRRIHVRARPAHLPQQPRDPVVLRRPSAFGHQQRVAPAHAGRARWVRASRGRRAVGLRQRRVARAGRGDLRAGRVRAPGAARRGAPEGSHGAQGRALAVRDPPGKGREARPARTQRVLECERLRRLPQQLADLVGQRRNQCRGRVCRRHRERVLGVPNGAQLRDGFQNARERRSRHEGHAHTGPRPGPVRSRRRLGAERRPRLVLGDARQPLHRILQPLLAQCRQPFRERRLNRRPRLARVR
ncbi:hypothetical protein DFJ74DRAFT_670664 [Hyaloraphidium curvatum]|nr:hypothetical protein DFJ74DRAFT_670664 [Hyaloraphidium curvatum]